MKYLLIFILVPVTFVVYAQDYDLDNLLEMYKLRSLEKLNDKLIQDGWKQSDRGDMVIGLSLSDWTYESTEPPFFSYGFAKSEGEYCQNVGYFSSIMYRLTDERIYKKIKGRIDSYGMKVLSDGEYEGKNFVISASNWIDPYNNKKQFFISVKDKATRDYLNCFLEE